MLVLVYVHECSATQGRGTGAWCWDMKCCQKPVEHGISFPLFEHLLHNFSPAPFIDFLSFSPLLCLAVLPHFLTASASLEWLYHLSHFTSLCYFWVITVSCVTFWTVGATSFNIWLNSIFSFIFQLLSSFFYCLHLPWSFIFKILSFHLPFTAVLHYLLLLESVMLLLPLNLLSSVLIFCN